MRGRKKKLVRYFTVSGLDLIEDIFSAKIANCTWCLGESKPKSAATSFGWHSWITLPLLVWHYSHNDETIKYTHRTEFNRTLIMVVPNVIYIRDDLTRAHTILLMARIWHRSFVSLKLDILKAMWLCELNAASCRHRIFSLIEYFVFFWFECLLEN